jgi:hypothetical protein
MPGAVYVSTPIKTRINGHARANHVRQQAIVNAILRNALNKPGEISRVIAQMRKEKLGGATSLEASGW